MEQLNDNSKWRLAYYLLAFAAAIAAIYIVIHLAGGNKSADNGQSVCEQDSAVSIVSTKLSSTDSVEQSTTPDSTTKETDKPTIESDKPEKELDLDEQDVDEVKRNALEAIEEAQNALKESY